MVTYFRPRGIAAFITSTAYVAIVAVGGASIGANKLLHLSESASMMVTVALFVAYLLYGLRQVREAKRVARSTR